jgi:hypothetical protein
MSSDAVSKVTAARLSRDAYLYIRQSTLYQVINNTESTARQYDLQGRALALGWPAGRIHVIDIDQATPAPPPPTGRASSTWSPRCRSGAPGSCSAWNAPGWPATQPTGSSSSRSAPATTP